MIIGYENYTLTKDNQVLNLHSYEFLKQYDGVDGPVVKLMKNGIMYVEYVKDLKLNDNTQPVDDNLNGYNDPKHIICVETGERFDSLNDCVRKVGEGVKNCLYGRGNTHKGLHYVFKG